MIKGSSVPVVGNGMALGLTDGTNVFGATNGTNGSIIGVVSTSNGAYGKLLPDASGHNTTTGNHSLGITTDGTKSGMIADISNYQDIIWCIKY